MLNAKGGFVIHSEIDEAVVVRVACASERSSAFPRKPKEKEKGNALFLG